MLRSIGASLQEIYLTMLALVAVYLIATNAKNLNLLVKTVAGTGERSLVILQGRNPNKVL